jgi:hypothetical protein
MPFRYSGFDHGFALDTFMPDRAKPSLTCRCQMGDNRRSRVYSFFHEATNCHKGDIDFVEGITVRGNCILMRRQAVSRKRLRTARPFDLRQYGNSFSSIPVGFLGRICSKPSH